jgi:hypothetical protein
VAAEASVQLDVERLCDCRQTRAHKRAQRRSQQSGVHTSTPDASQVAAVSQSLSLFAHLFRFRSGEAQASGQRGQVPGESVGCRLRV